MTERKVKVVKKRVIRKVKTKSADYGPIEFLGNNTLHFSLMDGTRRLHLQKLPHGCMMVSVQNLGVSEGLFFLNDELSAALRDFLGVPRIKIARNHRKPDDAYKAKKEAARLALRDKYKNKERVTAATKKKTSSSTRTPDIKGIKRDD